MYNLVDVKRNIYRKLNLTSMQKVLKELKKRGVKLSDLNALELFGYTGDYQTKDYAGLVKSLEVWEIDPACEGPLRNNLPNAKVIITDSFQQIHKTKDKYDFIVIDCNLFNGDRYEHFTLFPGIFYISANPSIIILTVFPQITDVFPKSMDKADQERLYGILRQKRKEFYHTLDPDNVTLGEMASTYEKLCNDAGFMLEWYFFQKRTTVHYLVMKIKKIDPALYS